MNRQRLIMIGAGLVLLVVVARLVISRPGAGEDVAVDTTGASAQARSGSTNPDSAGKAQATGTAISGTPAATLVAKPSGPTPTPVVVQIQGTAVSIEAKPLLLLNPSTVRQGSSVGVTGSGFDPGATVDIYVKQQAADAVDPLTFVQVDKSGGFGGVTFAVPDSLPRGNFIVEADQRESVNVARATAVIAGGSPQVKLGTQAAKSGDTVQLSAAGFAPDEDINVYWNDLSSDIIGTLHTDESGGLRQGSVRVPFGAVGNNGFIFVGQRSQSPVTVPFQMLNLYPSVDLSSYAIKPDNVLSFSGKDFGPGEQVTVYLNSPDAPPLTSIQADDSGGFTNAGGFLVPFGLRGKQTLIFMGKESKAPTTASFDTLPYTPSAQPSTYGGRPGTTLTFYAIGFARNEIVHALVGRTADSPGSEVSCFRTDPQGNAASGGSYVVPGDATPGQLVFSLIGSRSEAVATAALEVIASDVPVQVPPQAPFQCDMTDGPDAPQVVGVVEGPPALSAEAAYGPSPVASSAASAAAKPKANATPEAAQNAAKVNASAEASPTAAPKSSASPEASPTSAPAKANPTAAPKASPKASPTAAPKASPTASPKASPTAAPKASSTAAPKANPTAAPKANPTAAAKNPTPTAAANPPEAANAPAPAEPAAAPAAAAPAAASAPPAAEAQTYTVQNGDTLPSIANQVYGDANQWNAIYQANRGAIGDDPNLIHPGMQISIPAKES
jgi:nucleoid-associated protein YgaU